MDKKLTVLGAAIALSMTTTSQAADPFQTDGMNNGYAVSALKVASNSCGSKDTDAACDGKHISGSSDSSSCDDSDYKEFQAFKNSKYYQDFLKSDAYKSFKESQDSGDATHDSKESKGGKCSAGACG